MYLSGISLDGLQYKAGWLRYESMFQNSTQLFHLPKNRMLIFKTVPFMGLHAVADTEGNMSRIITAYFPNADKFHDDLKTRKER